MVLCHPHSTLCFLDDNQIHIPSLHPVLFEPNCLLIEVTPCLIMRVFAREEAAVIGEEGCRDLDSPRGINQNLLYKTPCRYNLVNYQ